MHVILFIFPVLLSSFFCPFFCVGWWVYVGHALRYGDVVRRKMVCNDITKDMSVDFCIGRVHICKINWQCCKRKSNHQKSLESLY